MVSSVGSPKSIRRFDQRAQVSRLHNRVPSIRRDAQSGFGPMSSSESLRLTDKSFRGSITHPLSVPVSPSSAVECYPCRQVTLNYNRSLLFHGGDTGSTPVRDAKILSIFAISTDIKQMKRFLMDLSVDGCGHSANLSLVESYVCRLERRDVTAVMRR
jgi:hypothetical protein